MCTTTLLVITKTEPASRLHAEVITEYLVFLRDHPLPTKRIERALQLLLGRFEKTPRNRRWFQVTGFLSNFIAILLELEWNPVTAAHWINDLEDTWTFDLSKTFDLFTIVDDIERASMRYLWRAKLLYIGMEKVWQLQHQISRCCADIFAVSARKVCLREPLCFSWRPVARVVTPRKLQQKSIVSTVAKGTPRATDLVDLAAKTDWILPEARVGLTKPELRSFFLRALTPSSWLVDLRFSLLPMPSMMVFTLALAHFSRMVPHFFPIHAVVMLVGVSALPQQISNCAQEHVDQSHLTMLLCLLAVVFLVERSVGPVHIHSGCKCGRNVNACDHNDNRDLT